MPFDFTEIFEHYFFQTQAFACLGWNQRFRHQGQMGPFDSFCYNFHNLLVIKMALISDFALVIKCIEVHYDSDSLHEV